MSELQQNQHQIQQSGEHVQEALLSQAELVAAILLKLFKRQERQNSLKTQVSAGQEKETVEIAIDGQVAAQPPQEPKPSLTLSLDLDDNNPPKDGPAPSESKPSLARFANSVHRQNDLRALASRPTQQGRDREHESAQEAKETQNSDLER